MKDMQVAKTSDAVMTRASMFHSKDGRYGQLVRQSREAARLRIRHGSGAVARDLVLCLRQQSQ